jgi:hypothetical protein
VVLLPSNVVPREEAARRLRTGLTIASVRLLLDVQRCYKCHILGHKAVRYTAVCSGKELCRRCCSNKHMIRECTTMCSRQEGLNAKHVTGSLACLMVRANCRGRKK